MDIQETYTQPEPESYNDYLDACGMTEKDAYFLKRINDEKEEMHKIMRENKDNIKKLTSWIIWGDTKNWIDRIIN